MKLQLINAAIIYDTAIVTSWLFRKSFNCRYNPRMDYAFCLLTLKSSEKWWSHYLVLHATSMTKFYLTVYDFSHSLAQMSFIYCHLNFHANLLRPWHFPLRCKHITFSFKKLLLSKDFLTIFSYAQSSTLLWPIFQLVMRNCGIISFFVY